MLMYQYVLLNIQYRSYEHLKLRQVVYCGEINYKKIKINFSSKIQKFTWSGSMLYVGDYLNHGILKFMYYSKKGQFSLVLWNFSLVPIKLKIGLN